MTDEIRDLAGLRDRLRAFVAERDWDQFHSPKNLSMALAVEAAELADILVYLVRIADRLDVDLLQAAAIKLEENARKYPAERVRGKALKYDEYD